MGDLRSFLAQAIATAILCQGYAEDAELSPQLTLPWLDQGEVDFGLVADAVLDVIRRSDEYGK